MWNRKGGSVAMALNRTKKSSFYLFSYFCLRAKILLEGINASLLIIQINHLSLQKKNIMKTNSDKSFLTWLILLIAVGIVCIIIGYSVRVVENAPDYSTQDSIALDSLKKQIDTIKIKETVVRWRVKTIRETDTVIYEGNDTTCIEIIERKNKLIAGQDTLIDLLDLEARNYSDMNLIYIRRNLALSDSIGTINQFYKDSLSSVNKRLYSGFFKRNHKWNRNEFRKFVMKKATD